MIRAKPLDLLFMPELCDLSKPRIERIQQEGLPFNPINRVYGGIGIFFCRFIFSSQPLDVPEHPKKKPAGQRSGRLVNALLWV